MNFQITDLIFRVPNFLTPGECQSLIDEHEERTQEGELEHCLHAVTGIDTTSTFQKVSLRPGTKNYDLMFKKNEQLVNLYLDHLSSFGAFHSSLLKTAFLYSHEYRLLKYSKGAKIHPHSDHGVLGFGSATFNLNDDYTGGTFKFFNGQYEVSLGQGEAMIWPADYFWVHEVSPVESGVRYSTNSFLLSHRGDFRDALMDNMQNIQSNWEQTNNFPPAICGPYKIYSE